LCPDPKDPDCTERVAEVSVGLTAGFKYGVQVGAIKGEVRANATAAIGLRQDRDLPTHEVHHSIITPVEAGVGLQLKVGGLGPDIQRGYQNADARASRGGNEVTTPVEGDGTIGFTGTIPLGAVPIMGVPVPVGIQVSGSLNVPAAISQIVGGFRKLFGSN
jgi:hypothetical protein